MNKNDIYLEHLKNSRELALGSMLRQSLPFKLYRHYRYRGRLVRVRVLIAPQERPSTREVTLLGVWQEDFPQGMPLEFLERGLNKWEKINHPAAAFQTAMRTKHPDTICVYSQHRNLHLAFEMGENCGKIQVEANGENKEIDLYSPQPATLTVYPNEGNLPIMVEYHQTQEKDGAAQAPALIRQMPIKVDDQAWLERQAHNPQPVSINNPAWRGILSSANELFDNIFLINDNLTRERAEYYARLFADSGVPAVVIQGFPATFTHLIKALRRVRPALPIHVIFHGNFAQVREDFEWNIFRQIVEMTKAGDVNKLGFVKQGMAEVMNAAGIPSGFLMNMVRHIPDAPSTPMNDGVHIAIWGEPDWGWRKPPYTMLASLNRIPGARGHAYNVSARTRDFGDLLALNADFLHQPVAQEKVTEYMAQMHLNMYVTLSECAPMVPLESLSVGAPCLTGPTSHYFQDDAYLYSRLVVTHPDNPDAVAEKANLALAERDQVIAAYRRYAPEYNRRARQSVVDFLELSE